MLARRYYPGMMDWLTRGFLSLQNPESAPEAYGSTEAATARYRRLLRFGVIGIFVSVVAATEHSPMLPHWFGAAMWIVYALAMLSVFAAVIQWVRTWDELQQRIFISSAANAFVFTLFVILLNLVLQNIGVPQLSYLNLSLLSVVAFAISWAVLRRSYE